IGQGDRFNDIQPNPPTIEYIFDILDLKSGAPPLNSSVTALSKPGDTLSAITAQSAKQIIQINGTSKNDSISITELAGVISVDVNGTVTTYAASSVSRFVVLCAKGNDYVTLQTSKDKHICNIPVSIIGAGGNDTLIGGNNNDTIYGGEGSDSVVGGKGSDSLFGNTGNDTLLGGEGDDILNGGDTATATGDGTDVLSGGPGSDSADYSARSDNLTVTMADDIANDGVPGENDNVESDIENFFSGSGDDHIAGTTAANFLSGNAGKDTLDGGDGNDKLIGGPGADRVDGNAGINLYLLQDGVRDDFDAPAPDIAFGALQFIAGDDQVDYSLISSRLIGR